MITYLKAESYYADAYDLGTIENCLHAIESWKSIPLEKFDKEESGKLSIEEKQHLVLRAQNRHLYQIKGEAYRKKAETIRKWMDQDQQRDEYLQNAQVPNGIRCSDCSGNLRFILKELYKSEKPFKVLFFFECKSCDKRKGIFDNGERFVSKPEYCPKCRRAIKTRCKEKGKSLIWSKSCSVCGFKETEIDDYSKNQVERAAEEKRRAELLQKHRAEFCFSTAEGEEYLDSLRRLEQLNEIFKHMEVQKKDPDHAKVANLNKWTIAQLQKHLSSVLKKEKYQELNLRKPKIDKFVIVPFIVRDSDPMRDKNKSVFRLQKLIKTTLTSSNWRLMSNGVHSRLGYLEGRLKGYEREEDMLQLIKQEKRK